ncbi:hypothetical protein TBR22_A26460 [Luteitalea sp. TBR-22]|uniref:hypothetical protein n=1 Tax=Luteitalea sp. TBR-22 TaxID=2802971 RepID=UPI001AF886C0|nr:hypothetical protein [Luteitalea sp. TBR-22]BCS33419.1 hypothetical protein TBR22_A26460 [Luteitalea sp. TBR-22]
MSTRPETTPDTLRLSTAWPWLVAVVVLVLVRSWPYAWWPTIAFDADQAVVGLMAKHIAEFRAAPVYQYALPYVLMVTAYVTAPFMWVLGATPFALKLPLVLMNVAVALLLVGAIMRAGIRPGWAAVLATPSIVPSGVASAGLMDALGMTVEPNLFVLLLWWLRPAPIAFGLVAAVGFHVREFVAYGVAAVVAVDLVRGALLTREGRAHWVAVGLSALGTSGLIAGWARFAATRGPGTWLGEDGASNLGTLGNAFCFVPGQAVRNVVELGASYLGLLWGAVPAPLSDAAVHTTVRQGLPWAWLVLGLLMVAACARVVLGLGRLWGRRDEEPVTLGLFLCLVGAQAVLVYAVSRCGSVTVITIRYALLGVFLPTGLALLLWSCGVGRAWRQAAGATLLALAALNVWPHVQLWREQLRTPSISNRELLGPALEARGLRYARSDYWTAYYVSFITQERVIVGADTLSRIDEYERTLARHAPEVVRIGTRPCGASAAIVPGYFVCRTNVP